MKRLVATALTLSVLSVAASLSLVAWVVTRVDRTEAMCGAAAHHQSMTNEEVAMVSPALEKYTNGPVRGDLWKRPDLSLRDRSIVTLAALIARNDRIEMPYYLNLALDSGVKPAEVSEILTHLAFYSGWGNAMSAGAVAKEIFAKRGIGADQLPAASPRLLPIDRAAEERRAAAVRESVGPVSEGLVQYTGELLFNDLWLRPDLAPRDRSLVTVSALIAAGQVAQIPFHLNRAMDNGLTRAQASEVITHLAFYAGWRVAQRHVGGSRRQRGFRQSLQITQQETTWNETLYRTRTTQAIRFG